MRLFLKLARVVLALVIGLALVASPIVVLLAVGGYVFIAATSPSDPSEKDLPLFAFYLVIALASGLIAFWSVVLPERRRPWRIGVALITSLVAFVCIATMVDMRDDPSARLGAAVGPIQVSERT